MNGQTSLSEADNNAFAALSDKIAEKCGEVSVGSSDIAGLLNSVIQSSEEFGQKRADLLETFNRLEQDQRKAADASDEARQLSQQGGQKLAQSIDLIETALGEISSLLELVGTLEQHIVGFAAAFEQVRSSTSQIDEIAEMTGILALNASIEAARAGEQGNSFSVVASEVKALAANTSRATAEINSTVERFAGEANELVQSVKLGAQTSREAESSVGQIEKTVSDVVHVFEEVDRNSEEATRATGQISGQLASASKVIAGFDAAAAQSSQSLGTAHAIAGELEITASEMFDSVVKAGLSPADSAMVEMALQNRDRIKEVTQTAMRAGTLDAGALFDTNYEAIEDSNPVRYKSRLTQWADENWRLLLDEMKRAHPAVSATVCSDMNGFLPTHRTERSLEPTGEKAHDDAYCRNGRIVIGPMTKKAKASEDDYQMAVYRHVGDGSAYKIVRNVYVPLIIDGRRWGDVELAYSI